MSLQQLKYKIIEKAIIMKNNEKIHDLLRFFQCIDDRDE